MKNNNAMKTPSMMKPAIAEHLPTGSFRRSADRLVSGWVEHKRVPETT
jgi:hypothetical protein